MDLLALKNYYENLEADMQRAARRIMAKLDHELIIEGKPYLQKLKPRVRVDLFLFYKECLVNISRHSKATAFSSHLSADKAGVSPHHPGQRHRHQHRHRRATRRHDPQVPRTPRRSTQSQGPH